MTEVALIIQIEEDLQRRAEAAAEMRGKSLSDIVTSVLENYVKSSRLPDDDGAITLKIDPLLARRFARNFNDIGKN